MPSLVRRLGLTLLALLMVVGVGTVGYHLGGLGWLESLYQTMITITTVGYNDMAPQMKAFTIALLVFGTFTIAVLISLVTGLVVETRLRDMLGRQKVEKEAKKLHDHKILCGFGRFGRTVADNLARRNTAFVAIENDPGRAKSAREHGYIVLEADATEEESLTRAGIERASTLLSTLDTDAANVYVTLSAKQMNRDVRVIALAHADGAASKLRAAGADEVVSPYQVGGNWMAQAVTSPTVADFMKVATGVNPLNYFMEEQLVGKDSVLSGRELRETPIRSELGVIVLAVRQADGTLLTNPDPDMTINAGDTLVSLGEQGKLEALQRMASGG